MAVTAYCCCSISAMSADSANGFAVLALYDLSSGQRLLDAANVAYDRSTYFRNGASLAISGDTEAVVTISTHFNSSQGYVTTALILPRDDRLELIDTIFTFDEMLCEFRREQVPSFKVIGAAGGSVRADRGDSDRDHDTVRRKLRRRKSPSRRRVLLLSPTNGTMRLRAMRPIPMRSRSLRSRTSRDFRVAAFVGGSAAG